MAIGTSTTRLFQQVGAAIGVTVLGTIVNQKMVGGLYRSLPSGATAVLPATDVNTLDRLLLNPSAAAHIPAPILDAIRHSFGNSVTCMFLIAVIFVMAALVVSLFIKSVPLKSADEHHEQEQSKDGGAIST